jgi:hypothetical protein
MANIIVGNSNNTTTRESIRILSLLFVFLILSSCLISN